MTKRQGIFREYTEAFVVAILIALILRLFILGAYKIPSASMSPTLKPGDLIFAWKLPYGVRIPFTNKVLIQPSYPKRGDVIIFRYPDDESVLFVKRVVGLPGDKIEIKEKHLFINDRSAKYEDLPKEKEEKARGNLSPTLFRVIQERLDSRWYQITHRMDEKEGENFGPQVVPEGRLFVLGDNRDSSDDSRFWGAAGMIPVENLEGRAVIIWGSLNWDERIPHTRFPSIRFDRVFSLIH